MKFHGPLFFPSNEVIKVILKFFNLRNTFKIKIWLYQIKKSLEILYLD